MSKSSKAKSARKQACENVKEPAESSPSKEAEAEVAAVEPKPEAGADESAPAAAESAACECECECEGECECECECECEGEPKPVVEEVSLLEQLTPLVAEKMAEADIKLSPTSVMKVLRLAMEAVEGSPIKGAEQKELAINIILELLDKNTELPEEQKAVIKGLVEGGVIEETIEFVVEASRGRVDINKLSKFANGCLGRLFRAFFRKESASEKRMKQELKDERKKQKKAEYNAMIKTILEREEVRKAKDRAERQKVIDICKKREEKEQQKKAAKEAKKEEKKAAKEAKKAAKEEKKAAKKAKKDGKKDGKEDGKKDDEEEKRPKKSGKGKKRPALNIPEEELGRSASVKVPSELNFPSLSSNLPDSVTADSPPK